MAFATLTEALHLASDHAHGRYGARRGAVIVISDTPALRTVDVAYRLATVRVHLAPDGASMVQTIRQYGRTGA